WQERLRSSNDSRSAHAYTVRGWTPRKAVGPSICFVGLRADARKSTAKRWYHVNAPPFQRKRARRLNPAPNGSLRGATDRIFHLRVESEAREIARCAACATTWR